MADTNKRWGQELHGIEKDILCFCVFDLAVILKPPVKDTLKFLNGCLHLFVAYSSN